VTLAAVSTSCATKAFPQLLVTFTENLYREAVQNTTETAHPARRWVQHTQMSERAKAHHSRFCPMFLLAMLLIMTWSASDKLRVLLCLACRRAINEARHGLSYVPSLNCKATSAVLCNRNGPS
jgi:hypothetical protein